MLLQIKQTPGNSNFAKFGEPRFWKRSKLHYYLTLFIETFLNVGYVVETLVSGSHRSTETIEMSIQQRSAVR